MDSRKHSNADVSINSIEEICFGLNRQTDEKSLFVFLKKMTEDQLLKVLIPRLSDAEINECVEIFNKLIHNHLQHQEYHNLILKRSE